MKKDSQEMNRQERLMQSFWQLQKSIMGQVKQTALDHELSIPQFSILVMMQHKKQMPQKDLQARTHFPKSTLSHAIEGLVQAKLLNRTPMKGNRREIDLALSDKGKALLRELKSQEYTVHRRFENAVNSFTEKQFNELIHMHQHIISFFDGGQTE